MPPLGAAPSNCRRIGPHMGRHSATLISSLARSPVDHRPRNQAQAGGRMGRVRVRTAIPVAVEDGDARRVGQVLNSCVQDAPIEYLKYLAILVG